MSDDTYLFAEKFDVWPTPASPLVDETSRAIASLVASQLRASARQHDSITRFKLKILLREFQGPLDVDIRAKSFFLRIPRMCKRKQVERNSDGGADFEDDFTSTIVSYRSLLSHELSGRQDRRKYHEKMHSNSNAEHRLRNAKWYVNDIDGI